MEKCIHCDGTGYIPQVKKDTITTTAERINSLLQSPRTKITKGRILKLKTRLKTFTSEEVCIAAVNLSNSAWHMGDNPGNVKYANIDFLLRTDEQVDKWLNIAPQSYATEATGTTDLTSIEIE